MCFCNICGILLPTDFNQGRPLCRPCLSNRCQLGVKTLIPCVCEYCCRSFDWIDTEFQKRGIMGKVFSTRKAESDPPTGNESDQDSQATKSSKFESIDEDLKRRWEKEQLELKKKLVVKDSKFVRSIRQQIEDGSLGDEELYIGGVDISFIKGDAVNACSAFVVLSYPDLEIVYEDYEMVKLTAPYIPGFLAFREVEFIIQQYRHLEQTKPQYLPQVIFVDGNGILHPRGFGLASHLGVLLGVPSLGVAKTLIHVDGVENDDSHRDKKASLKKGGDTFLLEDTSGNVLGKALRSCDNATNPVYVSPGHLISVDTAVWLVLKCCKYRIPEPTRKADLNSREYLRINHPNGC